MYYYHVLKSKNITYVLKIFRKKMKRNLRNVINDVHDASDPNYDPNEEKEYTILKQMYVHNHHPTILF